MEKKMAKAIRLINGHTDDLRVKIDDSQHEDTIFWFLLKHRFQIFGSDEMCKYIDDQDGLYAFLHSQARRVCRGEFD